MSFNAIKVPFLPSKLRDGEQSGVRNLSSSIDHIFMIEVGGRPEVGVELCGRKKKKHPDNVKKKSFRSISLRECT